MTQRIFDIENEKDIQDLWSILPDCVDEIRKISYEATCFWVEGRYWTSIAAGIIKINWHDKTEITRLPEEATEQDIGKLCKFWDDNIHYYYGILEKIGSHSSCYYNQNKAGFSHCCRLTKQEIEELS